MFHVVKIGLLSRSESSTCIRNIYFKLLAAVSIIWVTKNTLRRPAVCLSISGLLLYGQLVCSTPNERETTASNRVLLSVVRRYQLLAGYTVTDCIGKGLLVRHPEELENSEFYFPRISTFLETKSKEKKIEIRGSETKFTVPQGTSH